MSKSASQTIPCPCGGSFSIVLETRGSSDKADTIWRRRTCHRCERQARTIEFLDPDYPILEPGVPAFFPKPQLTVHYNLAPTELEARLRSRLVELGWTPPAPRKVGT